MPSKYVDTAAIIQVIGSVYKNTSLLDSTEKYFFSEEDFPDKFHKIIFGSIYKIHELGAQKVTIENITDYLSSRPKQKAIYDSHDGNEFLQQVVEAAQPLSFDYYYNRLKKMTLLRAYDAIGLDVSKYYDPDNIFEPDKKQKQEEWLDNTPLEKIAESIENDIEQIKLKYAYDSDEEASQAGKGIQELIESLKQTPEIGIPMYGPLINTVTRGARLKKFYLRSGYTGGGKAIPNDTVIPTPNGMRKVGDIKVGDYLFDEKGNPTKVLNVYPQGKKEVWEISFLDGRIAKCCEDHLWEIWFKSHNQLKSKTESLKDFVADYSKTKHGLRISENKGYKYSVKYCQPVNWEAKKLSPTPYAMGAILGDGSFRYNSTNKSLTFSSSSDEIPNLIAKELGDSIIANKNTGENYLYTFKNKNNLKHNLWVEEILKNYPGLWNTKSETKFIPQDYLTSSVEQRIQLLQGLLDTDGHIDEKGRVEYTTISPYLRDNVIFLCYSLGITASYSTDSRNQKYTTGECYKVHIAAPKEMKPCFFRVSNKKQAAITYSSNGKRSESKQYNSIVAVSKTNEKAEMTCFTVDSESHLFLMNDFIVTHNTRQLVADACYFGCDEIYDSAKGKWIKDGSYQPTLYITTEQELSEIQTMMLAFLADVPEDHILDGQYLGDEEARINYAAEVLKRSKIYVEELPDFSLQDVENTIKKNIREHNVLYVVNL